MSGEGKDPAIKLFGKTIPLPELPQRDASCSCRQLESAEFDTDQETEDRQENDQREEDDDLHKDKELSVRPGAGGHERLDQLVSSTENSTLLSGNRESPGTPPIDEENPTPNHSKPKEKQVESGSTQDGKTSLKKPDKILPCPRCNSMETKFCYYNNYNVNQPRHFCKNCQRYWTAGGTMRNVPVGAGRRKNKSSSVSSNNRQPFAEAEARPNILDGVHHLSFEHPVSSGKTNPTGHIVMSPQVPTQVPYFPGAPCSYPWVPPLLPPPLCSPPAFPMPIYPVAAAAAAAAYWGCSAMGNWSAVPGMPRPPSPSTSASANPRLGKDSPLGKHPREEAVLKQDDIAKDDEQHNDSGSDQCLWIPKTLRIDDPSEAAKSSIWATLGINKNDNKVNTPSKGTLLKAFQPKVEEKNRIAKTSPALQVNPAALSRSFHFHESS